ncbi:MAG: hypothetical protein ACQ9ET_00255 [Nitrosomonadaceae bacterium]
MLRLNCEITIADQVFTFVNGLEIVSSWDKFTDTAMIIFPGKITSGGKAITGCDDAQRLFRRGSAVTIRLGYFPNLTTVFTGFVKEIHNNSPLMIMCEDAAYLLKQNDLSFTLGPDSTLTDILNKMLGDIEEQSGFLPLQFEVTRRNADRPIVITANDAKVGFRVKRANMLQVLQVIKRTYGLVSYIRDGVLKVGLAYDSENRSEHTLSFQRNIIEDDLVFRCGGDVQIKMVVKSIVDNDDNTVTIHQAETGSPTGETKTFFLFNGETDEQELKDIGDAEIIKYKFDGYRGSLVTFGDPIIRHGDLVTLNDKRFPEREGTYLVDEVATTFGMDGFRQQVTLGPQNG